MAELAKEQAARYHRCQRNGQDAGACARDLSLSCRIWRGLAWPATRHTRCRSHVESSWQCNRPQAAAIRRSDCRRNRLRSASRRAVDERPGALSRRLLARDGAGAVRSTASTSASPAIRDNAPLSCRPDWKLDGGRKAGSSLAAMQEHVLDRYQPRFGILNCLYGAQVFHSEDMAAAFCRATNDWIRDEWLSRDARLRASIVIRRTTRTLAVAEIERRADDFRFVQVLMLVSGEVTLGRRQLWPIYQARRTLQLADRDTCRQHLPPCADRHRLAVLLCRGLHRAIRGLREPAAQHDRRRRLLPSFPA